MTKKERIAVKYYFCLSSVLPGNNNSSNIIKFVEKFINDEATAIKYIEGRKNAFSKYFKEDRPPMVKEELQKIKYNNIPIKGYTLES